MRAVRAVHDGCHCPLAGMFTAVCVLRPATPSSPASPAAAPPLLLTPLLLTPLVPHVPCRRRYVGTDGVYTLTTPYERDDKCPICSAGVGFEVQPGTTLQQVRGLL